MSVDGLFFTHPTCKTRLILKREKTEKFLKRSCVVCRYKGPSINNVTLVRGAGGLAKNVTIVLIGCVTGTVTRREGGVQEWNVGNLCDDVYRWSYYY